MPAHRVHRHQQAMLRQTCVAVHRGARRSTKRSRNCERLLGCSVETFVARVGFRPELQIDHIIPLSSSSSLAELHHHTNLQVLTAEENLKKAAFHDARAHASVALLQLRYGRPNLIPPTAPALRLSSSCTGGSSNAQHGALA